MTDKPRIAPDGFLWVCMACGKTSRALSALTDDDLLALVATRWPGWRLVPPNAPPTVATNGTAAAPWTEGK